MIRGRCSEVSIWWLVICAWFSRFMKDGWIIHGTCTDIQSTLTLEENVDLCLLFYE